MSPLLMRAEEGEESVGHVAVSFVRDQRSSSATVQSLEEARAVKER